MSTSQIMLADRESISPSTYTDVERGWINVKECSGHGPSPSTGGSSTIPIMSHGHSFGRTTSGNGRIASPGPAGAISFAATALLLSLFNVQAGGVEHPEVLVSMAVFTGGLSQFMAGMWEYPRGNVFNATLFSLYGSFWMSYATIFIPASGILAAYEDPLELNHALGLYLITWTIVTAFFLFVVIRRNLALTVMLSTIFITLVILSTSQYSLAGMPIVQKAGGVFGIIGALLCFYIGVNLVFVLDKARKQVHGVGCMHDSAGELEIYV
ncbi:fun34 transmembrane protein [Lentinula edodes]|uniref:Fun34 transmembrane protein n=1 Tax=Lentinula edodes TaxID=5353 RepID=A0A1Q3ENC3_LENED|nr:fun34 transmembrane protein [Lentinula edodes]